MAALEQLLVVEDAPDVLEMLEQILRFAGYDVLTARNGEEALEVLHKRRPALIITDILMPRMDGFSLIYRLRTDTKSRDIPVVFLTATYVSPEDQDFATTLGATRFIQKPIDTKDFLQTVTELLHEPPGLLPAPPRERDFFEKYEARLKAKVHEKTSQIARDQQLLMTVPGSERASFEATIRQSMKERELVETELHQVREYLLRRPSPRK